MKKILFAIAILIVFASCKTSRVNPMTKCSFEATKQYSYNKR